MKTINTSDLQNQSDFQNKSNSKIPWGSILVFTVVVSFVVSSITGYFTGGKIKDFFDKNKIKGEISGVTTTIERTEEESATTDAVEKVRPAVVSVVITKDLSKMYGQFYDDNFFSPFFKITPPAENGDGKQEIGGGTGFFASSDGMIITNKHVVQDKDADYTVITQSGDKYEARVLARDPVEDFAVLKVDGENFPTVELGDSDTLKVGQTVIAIGNSLGQYQNSVTKGIVSGLGRDITAGDSSGRSSEKLQNIIQTDAAINQGNSGGPLISLSGQVVGINTAVDFSGQLVGFALPVDEIKDELNSVRETGKIKKPYLGVRYVLLDEEIAKKNDFSYSYGALVVRGENVTDLAVAPGSPADIAGIEENDIILEVNGSKINSDNDLSSYVQSFKVDDVIRLKIWHDGEEKQVEMKLMERPQESLR